MALYKLVFNFNFNLKLRKIEKGDTSEAQRSFFWYMYTRYGRSKYTEIMR